MTATLQSASARPFFQADRFNRAAVPAWLMSLGLHAALFVTLAVAFKVTPRGTGLESPRAVGVVLRHTSAENPEQAYYEEQGDSSEADNQTAASNSSSPLDDAAASATAAATAPAPSAADVLGPGANALGSSMPGGTGLLAGSSGSRGPLGGQARTQVFGIPADGYKFVYVFDRSGSMGGQGARALNRAKAELLASLESLGETHQFQIIFYNERPTIFNLAGQPGRLVFGNHPNKAQAHKFVQGIVADGGTEHEPAILAALKLSPDVIFFLTDADQPELTPTQLRKIADRNRHGTVINTIEFGAGPRLGENFLSRLAAQNGGQYRYVDITKR
jgi:hypothetical protein